LDEAKDLPQLAIIEIRDKDSISLSMRFTPVAINPEAHLKVVVPKLGE